MEKSRQVCVCAQGGMGKGRNALGTACGGPAALPSLGCSANNPSLHTHAEPQGKGLRRGEGAALRCGEGANESLDFVHSTAETPALLFPHTSGEQTTRGREGGMEGGTDRGAEVGLPRSACAGVPGYAGGKSRALLSLANAGKGLCSVT